MSHIENISQINESVKLVKSVGIQRGCLSSLSASPFLLSLAGQLVSDPEPPSGSDTPHSQQADLRRR